MKKHGPAIIIRLILISFFGFATHAILPVDTFALDQTPDFYSGNMLYAASPDSPSAEDEDFDFLEEEYETAVSAVYDPLEPWNRAMFRINDSLYFRVLKPVATAYGRIIPKPARTGIKNFFHNIKAPIRIVNCILQGKGKSAMAEYSAFIVNSTAGFLGFSDPAGEYPGLNPGEEDLGQTLGHYGVNNGIYLVWPLFGFSTLRDTVGMVGDSMFLNPVSYIEPMEVRIGITAEEKINSMSLIIGDYETLKDASITPYEAFRNAYIQHRNSLVKE
jgi:phospholipid-binding lipoprotein MlaA